MLAKPPDEPPVEVNHPQEAQQRGARGRPGVLGDGLHPYDVLSVGPFVMGRFCLVGVLSVHPLRGPIHK